MALLRSPKLPNLEEVKLIRHEYHAALGALISKYEATVERFAGDGLLVLFNDPLPCPDPERRAVLMSIEMRGKISRATKKWQATGHKLGFGIGIASGHATLGCIGFEGRFQYLRPELWPILHPGFVIRHLMVKFLKTPKCALPSNVTLSCSQSVS